MDKPFLRFNDYLGLSSILRSDDVSERDVAAEVQENRPGSSTCFFTPDELTRIDQRIEEIINEHTRKKAMENFLAPSYTFQVNDALWNNPVLRCSGSGNVPQPTSPPFVASNLLLSSVQRPSTSSDSSELAQSCLSPPRNSLILNSLSNSPISPALSDNSLAHKFFPSSSPDPSSFFALTQPGPMPQDTVPAQSSQTVNLQVFDTHLSLQRLAAQQRVARKSGCSFCRNNKEVDEWVTSHQLKDSLNRVTCPVLRSYVCPLCFASGDNAHTLGHCPLNPDKRHSSLPLAVRRRSNATGKVKL